MTKQKTTKQHEEQYWHIPKFSLLPILGIIIFSLLTYGNYFLINMDVVSTAFHCTKNSCNLVNSDLINLYPIFGEYILFSLLLISIAALFKGGYNKLKYYDEEVLIDGLIVGLIFGLISGLIGGLIFGLIFGLISGLISSLISSLILEFN